MITPKPQQEDTDSFPILSLPLELRRHIYSFLLIPTTTSIATPRILWHDRHGPQKHASLHPQILLANKQINSEATAILYENTTFKINISTPVVRHCKRGQYADRLNDPQYLLRSDGDGASIPRHFDPDYPGFIYRHCLQRMTYLEVRVSAAAIWGNALAMAGDYFSHIGELFVEKLTVLAEGKTKKASAEKGQVVQQEQKKKKRLLITVHKDYVNADGTTNTLFRQNVDRQPTKSRAFGDQTAWANGIPPLVETVASERVVDVVEVVTLTNWNRDQEETTTSKTRKLEVKDFGEL
ncbi:MAG: hypothetical protein L6R40_008793 [Gallowayella cf. fulva]|nr:MAG: hypothetical protein L6R40_008793 [Xanthomendoza cf. fulva]